MSGQLLIGAAALGAAFYYWQQSQQVAVDAAPPDDGTLVTTPDADVGQTVDPTTEVVDPATSLPGECPEGYRLIADGNCCPTANIQADGTCGLCEWGSKPATNPNDPEGGQVCCGNDYIDSAGVCQTCPIGFSLSADGLQCLDAAGNWQNPNDFTRYNINTGSRAGDIASLLGIGLVSGFVMDTVVDKGVETLFSNGSEKAAKEAAEKAASEAAEKVAKEAAEEVAEKVAREAAEKVAKEAAEKAAKEAAEKAAAITAKKVAAKTAQKFGTKIGGKLAAKLATKLALATAQASTVVGIGLAVLDLMLMAVVMTLQNTLPLDADDFQPSGPGEFGFSE